MTKGGHITLTQDALAMAVANQHRTAESINHLTDQLVKTIELVASTSYDRPSLTKAYQKVIVALATLQNSVQDLSKAYINHANTVLNPGRAGTLDLNVTTTLLDSGLLTHRASPGMKLEAPGDAKKKRKRAPPDPNAPKRALTPYFLYMQSARPQIAVELGSNAKPKEVADEGTRRWSAMPDADKNVWNAAYQRNLAVYRLKTAAYKAGQPLPTDEEAEKLAQVHTAVAAAPVEDEMEVVGEEEGEDEDEEDEDEDAGDVEDESESDSSPEPVRAPSPPKSSKRRKTSDKQAAATPVKEATKTSAAAKASTEKEKKQHKKSRKEATPPPSPKAAEKKSKKKSKRAI